MKEKDMAHKEFVKFLHHNNACGDSFDKVVDKGWTLLTAVKKTQEVDDLDWFIEQVTEYNDLEELRTIALLCANILVNRKPKPPQKTDNNSYISISTDGVENFWATHFKND